MLNLKGTAVAAMLSFGLIGASDVFAANYPTWPAANWLNNSFWTISSVYTPLAGANSVYPMAGYVPSRAGSPSGYGYGVRWSPYPVQQWIPPSNGSYPYNGSGGTPAGYVPNGLGSFNRVYPPAASSPYYGSPAAISPVFRGTAPNRGGIRGVPVLGNPVVGSQSRLGSPFYP